MTDDRQLEGSSTVQRWMVSAVALPLLILFQGCSNPPAANTIPEGDSFQVAPFEKGVCSFDTRTVVLGVNPDGAVVWEREVPFSWSNRLLVHEGIGVLEVEDGVVAFEAESGSPVWQIQDDGQWRTLRNPTGVGLVNSSKHKVSAVDWISGATRWRYGAENQVAFGGAADGARLFVNIGGSIVALDGESGMPVWKRETIGDSSYPPQFLEGMLIYPSFEGVLYRLDPESGRIVWQWATPEEAIAITDSIRVSEGVVLVTTTGWSGHSGELVPPADSSRLVAIDAETGAHLWSRSLAEVNLGAEAEFTPGSLIYASDGYVVLHRPFAGRLEVIRVSDGKTVWEKPTPSDDVFSVTSKGRPILYVGFGSRQGGTAQVHAMTFESGEMIWTREFEQAAALTISPIQESLYVSLSRSTDSSDIISDAQGDLISLDPATGQPLWSLQTREGIPGRVVDHGGHLLVVTSDPSVGCA